MKVVILCINCTSLQYVHAGQIGAAAECQGPGMDCIFYKFVNFFDFQPSLYYSSIGAHG